MSIIWNSPLDPVSIDVVPLTPWVFRGIEDRRDKAAIIEGPTGRVITFGELEDMVRRLGGGLAARGIGPGSVVALMAPNVPEYVIAFHAIAWCGATATTLNPLYTADELRHQLMDSEAVMMMAFHAVMETAQVAVEGTAVTEMVAVGASVEGTTDFDDLFGEPIDQVEIDPASHVVVLPYSSGTTGRSKGVQLTHMNLVANLAQISSVIEYREDEVGFAALPFFHIYGMQVLMNSLLASGVTIVTVPRFDLAQAMSLLQEHKVTVFFAVPPMVLALAKQPMIDDYDLSALERVFCGAAPLGSELAEEAAARVDCDVMQAYGMTELSPVSHAIPLGRNRPGSSGVAVANTECRIVDPETGEDLPADNDGELWIRGPQVMTGYLKNPEATAETLDADGWLHTGDIARIDADGYMYIVDRVKELIKYKGFQVAPAELEALLMTHPDIADAAVIGIPEIEAGELPKAFVVLKPGTATTEADVREFVKGQVASYKQLRMVEFVPEIPKSASGKILRRLLRDRG